MSTSNPIPKPEAAASASGLSGAALVNRAARLQYFTIAYNATEGIVSLANAKATSSVALFSFGIDSLIEFSASLFALGLIRNALSERRAGQAIAISLFALAGYTGYESIERLISGEQAEFSFLTLAIATASVIIMPWLSRAKKAVAAEMNSSALRGEAAQTDFCFYLSVILLLSSAAHWLLGWTQIDSVGALLMTPFLIAEARRAGRGESCGSCGCH